MTLSLLFALIAAPACDPAVAAETDRNRLVRVWFDERFYLTRYADVETAVLGCVYGSGFDHFVLHGAAEQRDPSPWFSYLPEAASSAAVRKSYPRGVPHTDRHGARRTRYDARSFFPRCIYHAIGGSFQAIADAGFNCAHVWEGHGLDEVIEEARAARLQLIRHWPTDAEVRRFAADPNILAWYLDEEPVAQTYLDMERTGNDRLMAERYRAFLARKAAIQSVDSGHPVFTLGTAWVPPGLGDWWARWETSGDLTAHDSYPVTSSTTDFADLAASVTRAGAVNRGRKPVWVALQAFTGTADRGSALRMPTPAELRGMAFTAIVHGATGLIFFAYDSWVTRDGLVIGVGPETPERYGARSPATPGEVIQSRALWAGLESLNRELERLTPWLLSPTARTPYTVTFSGESRTPDPIRATLRERNGEYALLVASLERAPMTAGFWFDRGLAAVIRVEPDGRETALRVQGTTFQDGFGGFGAATYLIRFR